MLGPKLWAVPASDANIDSWIHMVPNHFRVPSSYSHVDISDGAVCMGFFIVNSNSSFSMYRLTYMTFPVTRLYLRCLARWSRKLVISAGPHSDIFHLVLADSGKGS